MAVSGETCFLSPEQCNYRIDQQGQTTYTLTSPNLDQNIRDVVWGSNDLSQAWFLGGVYISAVHAFKNIWTEQNAYF